MRKISIVAILTLIIATMFCMPIYANENDEYSNEWVYDEANVISIQTEEYIKNINENIFPNYENKPQIAIVVIDDLPYNIDDYALELFNHYGVGTKEENCGMLFLFAINDRQYCLKIGDGFEKGSILRDDLETDFITEDMKNSLRAENYDSVILQVVKHLETIMTAEENGIYAEKEAIKEAELILQYEKAQKAEALRKERFQRFIKFTGIFTPIIGIGAILAKLIKRKARKRAIAKMFNEHQKYLSITDINKEEFAKHILDNGYKVIDIKTGFIEILYDYFLEVGVHQAYSIASEEKFLELYKKRYKKENTFSAFKKYQVISMGSIKELVDREEKKKEETKQKNIELVNQFLQSNEHRITHKELLEQFKEKFRIHYYKDRIVTSEELNKTFEKTLTELNFRWEVEQFVAKYNNLSTEQHFDKEKFINELTSLDQYHDYDYQKPYDNYWMHAYLIMHITNNKRRHEEHIRRQEQERLATELDNHQQANHSISSSSSFGKGFGGGSSSGGGFRGGW